MSTANGSAQILDDLALAHALADLADAITLDRFQTLRRLNHQMCDELLALHGLRFQLRDLHR